MVLPQDPSTDPKTSVDLAGGEPPARPLTLRTRRAVGAGGEWHGPPRQKPFSSRLGRCAAHTFFLEIKDARGSFSGSIAACFLRGLEFSTLFSRATCAVWNRAYIQGQTRNKNDVPETGIRGATAATFYLVKRGAKRPSQAGQLEPSVVSARVAGYDSAVFGPPSPFRASACAARTLKEVR